MKLCKKNKNDVIIVIKEIVQAEHLWLKKYKKTR